ncbi:hypothetical protein [Nonomuraea sp. NPDC002799]
MAVKVRPAMCDLAGQADWLIAGGPSWRRAKPDRITADLVERAFTRTGAAQLWITDISEHLTSEGKVYCCVVLGVWLGA